MFLDVVLATGIAITQLVITVYAVVISIQERRLRAALVISVIGLIGIGLTVAGTIKNSNEQRELTDRITAIQKEVDQKTNADIAIYSVLAKPPVLSVGLNIFKIDFKVVGATAKNIRYYEEVFPEPGIFSQEKAKNLFSTFESRALPKLDFKGPTLIAESKITDMKFVPLTDNDLKKLSQQPNPTLVIYHMAEVRWENPSGSQGELSVCRLASPPLLEKLMGHGAPLWHNCFH